MLGRFVYMRFSCDAKSYRWQCCDGISKAAPIGVVMAIPYILNANLRYCGDGLLVLAVDS